METPMVVSIGAAVIAALTLLVQVWYGHGNARRSDVAELRDKHKECERKLSVLQAQFDDLSHRYLLVLEELVRRGIQPQTHVAGHELPDANSARLQSWHSTRTPVGPT